MEQIQATSKRTNQNTQSLDVTQFNDYRNFFTALIRYRTGMGAKYSARALARDIGLSPSRLNDVFAKRRKLSVDTAAKIASRLSMTSPETEFFCGLVQASDGKTELLRNIAKEKLNYHLRYKTAKVISDEELSPISDWYYFVILELVNFLRPQTLDSEDLAKRLSLPVETVAHAVTRLVERGFIVPDGPTYCMKEHILSTVDVPSVTIRKIHRQMLSRASEALESQPVEMRDFSASNFPIKRSLLPQAKSLMAKFRSEFRSLMATEPCDAVYTLSMQFYRQDCD